jgi:preprotein translocase subunit SecA
MLSRRNAAEELPRGLDAAWNAVAGGVNRLVPRSRLYLRRAQKVLAQEKDFHDLSDARLRESALGLRDLFRRGRERPADLERGYAVVREVAFRQLGQKPFLVQVAGALALHAGSIVEMATGEGKTLTATMPAVAAGWRGRGCHILTTNDYLAQRDAEWMDKVYRFCGLSTGFLTQETEPPARRAAYQADITYLTNKEVAADFLRDRLALGRFTGLPAAMLASIARGGEGVGERLVQRGLEYAIIDEADSIMIDEAVTPLIISGQAPNPEQVAAYQQAATLAAQLMPLTHYRVKQRYHEIDLTDSGKEMLARLGEPLGGIWAGRRRREELVSQALTAREFYVLGKQYIVQDGKVVIVDEFTGRLMADREWRDGLHQAVEAKEGLTVNPPKDTYARVSFQRFFRMYRKLSGMTGTAQEAWREFWQIYRLPVVVIPTNRPCIRTHQPDRVYATESAKWQAVVAEIAAVHKTGRAILVGTRSVRASQHVSQLLQLLGLEHQVLNAINHAEEAQIVAAAGAPGRITVATNMAGRGTDIKLGRGVAELGGLHVIATERHESARIDRQLFGRGARQGDPGSAVAIVSLDDELVARHTPHLRAAVARRHGTASPATTANIASPATRMLFNHAQRVAQHQALSQRKGVLQSDHWLDEYLGFAGSER